MGPRGVERVHRRDEEGVVAEEVVGIGIAVMEVTGVRV
jgi:hypothetical protein